MASGIAHAAGPAGVAAEVNNDKIMLVDVERKLNILKDEEPSLAANSEEAKTALASLRQSILEEMINDQLLYQEAKSLNITPPKAVVDTLVEQFKTQFKDEAEMQKDLKAQGKTTADLRVMITRKLMVDELTEQWVGDVVMSDEDISKYYQAHKDKFKSPEGARTRHILIEVRPGAPEADRKKARTRADSLLTQVQAKNADFAKVARLHSDDPTSREQGGDLGVLVPDARLLESLKKAIFSAAVNKPVLVESEFGYHIVKVEEKIAARTLTLAEVKASPNFPLLKATLLSQEREERYEQKVAALRAKAKITKYI